MKKLLFAVLMASVATTGFGRGSGPAGCGLGTAVVFKRPSAWWQHVLAATTNQTSGNQTFGMTSGTLGCESARGPLAKVHSFLDENLEQLAIESAKGEGEALTALSHLVGIKAKDQHYFNQRVKAHFEELFVTSVNSQETHLKLINVSSG